jgi:hypothetical protein
MQARSGARRATRVPRMLRMRNLATRPAFPGDGMFVLLLLGQWAFAVAVTWTLPAPGWEAPPGPELVRTWLALVVGGVLAATPAWQVSQHSGTRATRQVLLVAQGLLSLLLIMLADGVVERRVHFLVALVVLLLHEVPRTDDARQPVR